MKVKILAVLLTVCLLSACAFAASVYAADSDVTVTFTAGTDPTPPVDPDDPSQPLTPAEPGTGEAGPLSIDYVTNITFGTQEISGSQMVYEANELKPFLQVTDKRGTGAGWHVTASASAFSDGTDSTLPGSTLNFNAGEALSANATAAAPTAEDEVALTTDSDVVLVISAAVDTGLGTWVDRWYPTDSGATSNNNVTLTVPAGSATLGTHTATITWTLTDAPA